MLQIRWVSFENNNVLRKLALVGIIPNQADKEENLNKVLRLQP